MPPCDQTWNIGNAQKSQRRKNKKCRMRLQALHQMGQINEGIQRNQAEAGHEKDDRIAQQNGDFGKQTPLCFHRQINRSMHHTQGQGTHTYHDGIRIQKL